MNIKVITINGPQVVQAQPLEGHGGALAVVTKWDDGEHAFSVAAPVPGTNVWIAVGSPREISQRTKDDKDIPEVLATLIDELPDMCSRYARNELSVNPVILQLAVFLGILTDDMVVEHNRLASVVGEARDKARREWEQRKAEEESKRLQRHLDKLKSGETIPMEIFLELLAAQEIALPARTVGMLKKKVSHIGTGSAQAAPGTKIADVVWLAVRQLAGLV